MMSIVFVGEADEEVAAGGGDRDRLAHEGAFEWCEEGASGGFATTSDMSDVATRA